MIEPSPSERRPLLTRDQLDRLQRARVLDAVSTVVAERGYADASVADVVARGGLSRRTFYELFDNKADAFFAAYDEVVDRAIRRMEAACPADADPEQRVLAGLTELLRLVERHPAWARLCVFEAPAASVGIGDRARHLRPVARWVERVHRVLGLDPRLDPLAHTGMVLGGLQASMASGDRRSLPLLRGLYRLTVGCDSPDVGMPDVLDGDPQRAARLVTALRTPVELHVATAEIVAATVDHDPRSLGVANDAIGRLLARRAAGIPRVDLLLLRHLARAALDGGPAGVLTSIGYSRTGDATNVTALRCLYHLAEHPGASGRELRDALGMRDAGASRLLGQLRDRGDVRSEGRPGRPKHWHLTDGGRGRLILQR